MLEGFRLEAGKDIILVESQQLSDYLVLRVQVSKF
jgi:hypothetical protein